MNISALSVAISSSASNPDLRIGNLLVDAGKLTREAVEKILRLQKELGIRFGEAAKQLGLINDIDIEYVLARQFDYPYVLERTGPIWSDLVAAYQPFSAQAEQFRAVRSQLMLQLAAGKKAFAVAAVNSGDGVSLFIANLAVTFAQLGRTTLLVDANLRTPRQHDIFGIPNRQGFADRLADKAEANGMMNIPPFESLYVLPSGTRPPNPQELVSRNVFSDLNSEWANHFDVLLYDSAPFSVGADAFAIARCIGRVLLIARRHRTRVSEISAITQVITRSGVEVIGCILVDP